MIKYQAERTMALALDRIWPYFVEIAKYGVWMGDMQFEPVDGAASLKAGSRMRYSGRFGPMKVRGAMEVVLLEPERRITMRTVESTYFSWQGTFTLESTEGGTRVTSGGEYRFHGLWRLLEPVLGNEIRKGEQSELARIEQAATQG